jgi:PASTA domain
LKSSRSWKLLISLVAAIAAALASAGAANAADKANKVLLFGPSVFGGANSVEAQQAAALGIGVDVVDASTWSSMTTAQFAAYRAIVIGDNHDSGDPTDLAAAESNAGVWGAAVNGNVIVTTADVEYHADFSGGGSDPGAVTYASRALAFAAGSPVQTGAYLAVDQYNSGAEAKVLDAFVPGGFLTTNDDFDTIHIDPAVTGPTGLSDSVLSDWGETAHSYFSRYPSTFRVWAIGAQSPGVYTTSDGQDGFPTFLVRPAGPTCTVPKLKGKSRKKAKKKLRNRSCRLGKVKGKGKKVKKQKPKAGTLLPEGSTVKITVR